MQTLPEANPSILALIYHRSGKADPAREHFVKAAAGFHAIGSDRELAETNLPSKSLGD